MKNSIIKNVTTVLICAILAKLLSYFWEAVLAAYLGTTAEADALYMTIGIFNILYPILDTGIWRVFLPIYKTKLVKESIDSATEFANVAETVFLLISGVLVVFIVFFAKPLAILFAPGFSEELKSLTAKYIRYSALMYFPMSTASVLGAILQSHDKFLGSQIREVSTHLSKIIVFIVCFRFVGVYAAIIAYIIGSVFRFLLQIPFVDWSPNFHLSFNVKTDGIKKMMRGLPSVSLTVAITQINAAVDKMFASAAKIGAVAALNYGFKLMSVFSGLVSLSISTATYPEMIRLVAERKNDELEKMLSKSISTCAFFTLPITVFCIAFSSEVVRVAFERGAFDSTSTDMTRWVFIGYAAGILFSGITVIVTNVFYAYGDTRITLYISIVNIVLNVIFDYIFFKLIGLWGVALATSVSEAICLIIRVIMLKKFLRIRANRLLVELLRIFLASGSAGAISLVVKFLWPITNVYVGFFVWAAVFGITYLIAVIALRAEAFQDAKKLAINKLKR